MIKDIFFLTFALIRTFKTLDNIDNDEHWYFLTNFNVIVYH